MQAIKKMAIAMVLIVMVLFTLAFVVGFIGAIVNPTSDNDTPVDRKETVSAPQAQPKVQQKVELKDDVGVSTFEIQAQQAFMEGCEDGTNKQECVCMWDGLMTDYTAEQLLNVLSGMDDNEMFTFVTPYALECI